MIKLMAAIRRRPGMTQQEYFPYIREVHGGLSKAHPLTVRRYVQNHALDGAFGCATDASYQVVFHRDSVTELWYDSFDSIWEAFAHPYAREKLGPDGANFSELGTALALLTRETEISVLKPSADAAVKVLYFLRKMQNLSLGEYVERWTSAHE